jgi:hypothetical protein
MFEEKHASIFWRNIMALTNISVIDEIIDSLTEEQKRIINSMTDGEYVSSLSYIASDCGYPRAYVLKHIRLFKEQGWVSFSHLTEIDGHRILGSGYFLSRIGIEIQFRIRAQLPTPTLPEGWGI